jgi:hypothetical protein
MYTYAEAKALIQGSRKPNYHKLTNNTFLRLAPNGRVEVMFHRTAVVTITPGNLYILNSGGYRTATTKDRINAYSPVFIYQKDYKWYIHGCVLKESGVDYADKCGMEDNEFQDGIAVSSLGFVEELVC